MMKKIIPVLIIIIVWLIFSKPFFLENKIPYPTSYQLNALSLWNTDENYLGPIKNPAMPDVVTQIMPWRHLTIESWKNLTIPLWNPYSFSGTPHLANYQSAVFSITNLFFFIFNFNNAWGLAVLIQPLLAGIFMYIFIRSLKLSQTAGLIASISFMFSGFITTWMSWSTLSLAIAFLPLALYSIEKYFELRKPIYLLILFISIPLSFFSGHFQTSIYFLGLTTLFLFFKFFETKNKKAFINSLIFLILGFLSTSIQILPSIELYQNASRSLIFQKINAIPFYHLATIISPDFYGNPVTRNNFLGHYIEWNMFTGVATFFLSTYALFIKSKKTIFFILVAILSLTLSLNTTILDVFINLKIPVLSTSSLSRIICIFSFSVSILAAFGIDKIKNNLEAKKFKTLLIWVVSVLIILSILWVQVFGKFISPDFTLIAKRNLILPTILSLGLIASVVMGIKKELIKIGFLLIVILVIFDMLRFATKWQPFESKELAYIKTPIVKELNGLDKNYRIFTPFGEEGSVYFNFQSTGGYDPLYIKRYGEFSKSLSDGKLLDADRLGAYLPKEGKYFSKTIDTMGIRYVLQKNSDTGKSWAFQFNNYPKDKFKLIYEDSNFQIFENLDALPKAYLVGDHIVETDSQKILNRMFDENFDLKKSVVLEKEPQIKAGEGNIKNVEIVKYSSNKILLNTESDTNSILIISDNFYPGWIARVNGENTEIIRANYTFRAVPIPAGKNNIEILYTPDSFRMGAVISFISVLIAILILIIKWYNLDAWTPGKLKIAKSAIKSSANNANGKRTKRKH